MQENFSAADCAVERSFGSGRLPFTLEGHLPGWLGRFAAGAIDRVLGLQVLQRLYASLGPSRDGEFPARALETLDVSIDVTGAEHAVPREGPLVVVANHPFGCADGLALLAVLARVRPDVRILANRWLAAIPPLRGSLVGVEIFSRNDRQANARALRAAVTWLRSGGCLIVFPAGEVAHRAGRGDLSIDGEWHPHVGAIVARSGATVVPVLVSGANRLLFRLAGRAHPLLRTALLPRELLARRHSRVQLTIGEPIASDDVGKLPACDRSAYLKARTYLLAPTILSSRKRVVPSPVPADLLSDPQPPSALAADVGALRPDRLLVECGALRVYCARAGELPHVLPEIGRLREVTFRAVGEGTGRAADLDDFDAHYWHLFAWDTARATIAGAYRVGLTSEILPLRGAAGLYTRTLFQYDDRLLRTIGPAAELGRSFVCAEYQRGFAPLLALWRGIGRFVARQPDCRRVFGAVSISSRYDTLSRQLLVRFLSSAGRRHDAARLVRPLRPLPVGREQASVLESASVTSLEGLSHLLAAIEPDGKSVPVLVRQYLNLNARLLAFSVDPSFGDALDGLMVADLTEVPRAMLQRLMGADEAARFLERLAQKRGTHFRVPSFRYLSSPFNPFLKLGSIAARSAR